MKLQTLYERYRKIGRPIECLICGSKNKLSVEHIIPRSRIEVKDRIENNGKYLSAIKRKEAVDFYFKQYEILCHQCNMMKGNMTMPEFMQHFWKILKWFKEYENSHPYYLKELQ